MRITCPACGSMNSLDSLIGQEAARTTLVNALEQTPVGRRLIRYVALFRPAQRQLSWDRVGNLLAELLDMIRDAKIERHGRLWTAPQDTWVAALDEILARRDEGKLTLPLKSHGYLLEIIAGMANKAEGQAERTKENHLAGRTPNAAPASHDDFKMPPAKEPRSVMPESVKQALSRRNTVTGTPGAGDIKGGTA